MPKPRFNEKTLEERIADLMTTCGFGEIVLPAESVSGGFLHRMYRVTTERGVYAVKFLNPEIMSREIAHENFARAEAIEAILEREGLPIVPAIPVNGEKMQTLDGRYFYIFPWKDALKTDWNHISEEQCRAAGNILGRIHAICPREVPHGEPTVSKIDWTGYLREATETGNEIAPVLEEYLPCLVYAENELNDAMSRLPDILCISDEDMDPKNVLWESGQPWVIDLECLNYGNPASHVLQLSLQWSGITTCRLEIGKTLAFFDGYLSAYDNGFRAYVDIFGLAYSWVDWLEYNIRRALGGGMDEKERLMGVSEVKNTVNRIVYLRSREAEIKEAFASRLR